MKINKNAEVAVSILEKRGFEAYIVGGCVRDAVMGIVPKDIDITTNALPYETREAFENYSVIETGIKHGTVTVVINGENIEITTYRVDGEYSDGRRPDNVCFTKSIEEDLARRDFTMNAAAYSEKNGFVDPFGGINDINSKIIRCVGEAQRRFSEDPLRILRAMRFSSVLGFEIEQNTKKAMLEKKELLEKISAERIFSEIKKIFCGVNARSVCTEFFDVLCVVFPEIRPMKGCVQNNKYHRFDVLEHTMTAFESVKQDCILRLAVFFHDAAKPYCKTEGDDGVSHFYGHPDKSEKIAREILNRLKSDNYTKETVCKIIKYHDIDSFENEKWVRKWLARLGEEDFQRLMEMKKADITAQSLNLMYRLEEIKNIEKIKEKVLEEKQCFSLKGLCVNGKDIIGLGISDNKHIGEILGYLLEGVIDGKIKNERRSLLDEAEKYCDENGLC